MLRVWQHVVFWASLVAAGPAMAEGDLLARPASCQPVLTVQNLGCQVETMLRCAEGSPWRAEAFDETGLFYVASFDQNFVQQEVTYPKSGLRFIYDASQSSSTSPAEVTATGRGVERTKGEMILADGRVSVLEYHDISRLDPPMELDGTALVRLRISGTRTITPPPLGQQQDFMNYYDPLTGFLFGGESLLPDADGKLSLSGKPVQLIQPGEPGFDSPLPKFDCLNLSFNVTDEKAFPS